MIGWGREVGSWGGQEVSSLQTVMKGEKKTWGVGCEGEAGRRVRERNIIYQSLKGRKHSKLKNRSFAPVLHSNFD